MDATVPVLAGMVSTVIFAGSTLPMLHKALRTRELSSYSLGNIALANVGNAVHSVYVFHLPPGPIWFLHTFYVDQQPMLIGRLTVAASGGLVGRTMLELSARIRVIAIARRGGGTLEYPPRRDTRFEGGDQAYLVGSYEELLVVLRRDTRVV